MPLYAPSGHTTYGYDWGSLQLPQAGGKGLAVPPENPSRPRALALINYTVISLVFKRICASYCAENSLIYHYNTRRKVIYMSHQFSQSLGEGY